MQRDRASPCLFQEPALVPLLTIEQNLFLGQERASRFGLVRRGTQRQQAVKALRPIAPQLDPARRVEGLRTSERQSVALAKALLHDPVLVIMDEPTASMTDAESRTLFSTIGLLKAAGKSVLYVTHRLTEVFSLADRVTVLRDGRNVLTTEIAATSRAQLVEAIAGRDIRTVERSARRPVGQRTLLTCRRLAKAGVFADVSFAIRAGEIVALAGLVGAGRTEIARAIFGADAFDSGEIDYPSGSRHVRDPASAVRAGVAMVPEDRKLQGVVPKMSVGDNILLSSLRRLSGRISGLRRTVQCERVIGDNLVRLKVRPQDSRDRPIESLSGGNQQKVVIARAIESEADLLILDEPTAGVDVETKAEIHGLVRRLVDEGRGILLISSEMEEVMSLADRILVIRDGSIVEEFDGHGASSTEILKSAFGEARSGAAHV